MMGLFRSPECADPYGSGQPAGASTPTHTRSAMKMLVTTNGQDSGFVLHSKFTRISELLRSQRFLQKNFFL